VVSGASTPDDSRLITPETTPLPISDKLRENHAHHGLEFLFAKPAGFKGEVTLAALAVRKARRGTFPVWLETARPPILIGKSMEIQGTGHATGLDALAYGSSLDPFPKSVPLLALAQSCPAIFPESGELGLTSTLARASAERIRDHNSKTLTYSLITKGDPPALPGWQ